MKLALCFILWQLSVLKTLAFGSRSISRFPTILNARRTSSDSGLLSYQSNEKEEIDNRPNYIHRAQVADQHPRKLLEFVCIVFPDVKRTQAKQWLQHDSLLVNDEPQSKFDLPLRIGDWISVKAGKSKMKSRSGSGGEKKSYGVLPFGLKIIYEDEALFVVDKPPGVAVSSSQLASSSSRDSRSSSANNSSNAVEAIADKKFVKKKDTTVGSNTKTVHSIVSSYVGKRAGSSESKVFVVNRLEDDVSGLVVLAKSGLAKEHLLKNWNSFGVVYNVLCEGLLFPQQGTIKTYMDDGGPNVKCSLTQTYPPKGPGSDSKTGSGSSPAVSHYRTLESAIFSSPVTAMNTFRGSKSSGAAKDRSISLLEVSLETSKRDQLRAQFAFLNHSVCGDYKYGPLAALTLDNIPEITEEPSSGISPGDASGAVDQSSVHDPIRRLGVHFSELRLTHPISKDALTVTSSCPGSFNDLIRRSHNGASSTSFVDSLPPTPDFKASDPNEEDCELDEDGQMDSLRSGSTKHAADSKEKVKVFTLTEFLGPKGKSPKGGLKRGQGQNQDIGPPTNSKFTFGKKPK